MSKDNYTLDKAIDVGADIVGELAAKACAKTIFSTAPLLGEIVGPIVTAVVGDVVNRTLSKSEESRVECVSESIVNKIKHRMAAGDQPRRDDNFYVRDEYMQSSASKLLEEVLIKCKQEYEAKKLEYYSNFWANICFENGISYETANSLISQFSSLNYLQIKILIYLNTGASLSLGKWEKFMFSNELLSPYYSLYSDSLHLYNIRLAAQHTTLRGGVQLGTPEIFISPSGKMMCRLFELAFRNNEEDEMHLLFRQIDEIVDRLKNESNDDGSDRTMHMQN